MQQINQKLVVVLKNAILIDLLSQGFIQGIT